MKTRKFSEPDRFGYLSRQLDIQFDCGEISTLPGFQNQFRRFEGGGMWEDKFFYPCRNWEEYGLYPMFRLPSSHQLSVELRNDLLHQSLWAGRSITGSAFQVYDWKNQFPDEIFNDVRAPTWLRKLNVRLVAAILGYDRPHTRREWWTFGEGAFLRRSEQ